MMKNDKKEQYGKRITYFRLRINQKKILTEGGVIIIILSATRFFIIDQKLFGVITGFIGFIVLLMGIWKEIYTKIKNEEKNNKFDDNLLLDKEK